VRIAHVGSKGIPSKGGTERVVEAIAARQAPAHRVTVYGDRAACASRTYDGVRVIALPTARAKHLGPVLLQLTAAVHALTLGSFDVIHVHGSENGFVVPLLRLRYPVVTTNHGPAYEREKWSPVARRLIRAVERFSVVPATAATAVAANQAESLSRRYGRQVTHVPNGVRGDEPIDRAAAGRILDQQNLVPGEYVMFAAARVDPTKGCHTLLEACRDLDDPPAVLVLGDLDHAPGYAEQLRTLAEGMRVEFLPRLDDKAAVLGLVSQSRVFVFPSTVEAMSMMLLEAMAVGAVTLCSDIPENVSVIPAESPVFAAGDAAGLRDALAALLTADPRGLNRAAADARRWVVERYDWDTIAREYEDVYRMAAGAESRA
jgi:glycosyltransferase involved in cell wall biosynthesis